MALLHLDEGGAFPHERRTPERSTANRKAWRFRTNTGFPGSAKDKSRGSALRSTFRAGPVTNQKETVHSYPIFMPLCRKGPGVSLSRFVVEFSQRGSCRTYDPYVKPGPENGSSQSRWPGWAEIHGFLSEEGFLSGKFPVVRFGQWSVSASGRFRWVQTSVRGCHRRHFPLQGGSVCQLCIFFDSGRHSV